MGAFKEGDSVRIITLQKGFEVYHNKIGVVERLTGKPMFPYNIRILWEGDQYINVNVSDEDLEHIIEPKKITHTVVAQVLVKIQTWDFVTDDKILKKVREALEGEAEVTLANTTMSEEGWQ